MPGTGTPPLHTTGTQQALLTYAIPSNNLQAGDYIEFKNWLVADFTVTPLLSQIQLQEISTIAFEDNDPLLLIIVIKCHTDAMEGHMKIKNMPQKQPCSVFSVWTKNLQWLHLKQISFTRTDGHIQ